MREQENKSSDIEEFLKSEETKASRFADGFLAALSPDPGHIRAKGHDIEFIKRVYSSLLEVMHEGIITESEACALTEFFASKLIERQFDVILQDIFDAESSQEYSFRVISGRAK